MHWNLMGEGASGKTRVGYVWLEFVRTGDGAPAWFTCGARLQASVHTTGVTADYFTTSARIDRPGGLALVNEAGQPLTRAALADALQSQGELHGSPSDYRNTVRSTLFPGLSEQRYEALITALLQLRTPKLSERLDPLWGRAGVADDQLSTTVLAVGLRLDGDGPVAEVSRICAEAGHPVSLTLAQLRSPGELAMPPGPVHITENPSVLALALRRFGPRCPPLVCTSGWPNTAAIHLLRRLAAGGASLQYHGDFDGEGVRIAAHVLAKTGARPWRMATEDYRAAATRVPSGPDPGRLTPAPWDPALVDVMAELRTAVVEEVIADVLLDDLADHRGR